MGVKDVKWFECYLTVEIQFVNETIVINVGILQNIVIILQYIITCV
jgi:hypothetical protein